MEIDPIGQSLLFSLQLDKKKTQKDENTKDAKIKGTKKTSFHSILQKTATKQQFLLEGLPQELCDMTEDEAVVFLKDNVDIAGDDLQKDPSKENMQKYRAAVGDFMKYIEVNAFDVVTKKRRGFNKKGKPLDPVVQIRIINQKLERLSSDLIYNHKDNLAILKAVGQINGLLVDLVAG